MNQHHTSRLRCTVVIRFEYSNSLRPISIGDGDDVPWVDCLRRNLAMYLDCFSSSIHNIVGKKFDFRLHTVPEPCLSLWPEFRACRFSKYVNNRELVRDSNLENRSAHRTQNRDCKPTPGTKSWGLTIIEAAGMILLLVAFTSTRVRWSCSGIQVIKPHTM